MEYNFREIERKWHEYWTANEVYKVKENKDKPKYYVLDMFPYPSGAGLHVGHPLGYIASDIYTRYKRLQGFNVLHPMGYDAYGLPAEQYAIQTGQHPEVTTRRNIARYREQMDKIGFSYDWSRELRTCDPEYYHWTQWAFIKMFGSYYCNKAKKALPIENLVEAFETNGTEGLDVASGEELTFTAEEWKAKSKKEKEEVLLNYRIAYRGETVVNWCPELGTVLANDEVVNGVSVRGGFPVEQKMMRQWCLRVSAYAQRLLDGLDTIDWTDSLKDTQRNWIGRSEGAEIRFKVKDSDTVFIDEIQNSAKAMNPMIFNWLDVLDVNVVVILVLIFAVAGFTMISGLLIIILERTNMIGILKALGENNDSIRKIFLYVSFFLIGKGMLWGNVIGLAICFVQSHFHVLKLDASTYYLDAVPISLSATALVLLNVGALAASMLTMLGPSYLITKIDPARSIRFE